MEGEVTSSIINAESETLNYLRFMRKNIQVGLLLTLILIIAVLANDMTAIAMGISMERMDEFLFLEPPPILFVALAISAVIEFYMLRKLEKGLKDLYKIRSNPVPEQGTKSITDINYGMVKAMERSQKIWPIVGFLFVLYFIVSILSIAGWTLGLFPNLAFNWTAVMNTIVLFVAIVFFWSSTKSWLVQRRRLIQLRKMEITVLEELHLRF
jgi:membrane protein implicated in regulation of membrane protease activity